VPPDGAICEGGLLGLAAEGGAVCARAAPAAPATSAATSNTLRNSKAGIE